MSKTTMARNLMLTYFTVILLIQQCWANKEVFYDLVASYFDGAPDGVPKRILGFNNQFPGPTLRATKGDILNIKVTNNILEGHTTTIHWHGMEQFLTPWEDGPRMLTQCDIPYNASYTYRFQAVQSGTYWYHSHHTGQYSEGMWGILIIDNTPEVHEYDDEFVVVFNDWFHLPSEKLQAWYKNGSLSKGGLPYPDSSLMNGAGYYPCEYAMKKDVPCSPGYAQRYKLFHVERNKTYRFRVVNTATIVPYSFSIDEHKLEAIETDGVDTIKVEPADRAFISVGARTSFLVTMNGDLDQYWIRAEADLSLYKLQYSNINPFPEAHKNNPTVLAVLRYKDGQSYDEVKVSVNISGQGTQGRPEKHDLSLLTNRNLLPLKTPTLLVNGSNYYQFDPVHSVPFASPPFPETTKLENPKGLNIRDCKPISGETAPTYVNQTIELSIPFIDDPEVVDKTGMNNITYSVGNLDKPALIKVIQGEELPSSLHPREIEGFGEDYVVEIIFNDLGDSGHPFHLHGHTFWVMGYGEAGDGPFSEERDRSTLRTGARRETIAVRPFSWLVIRFRADNPGVWLLHCHMNFHFEAAIGLVLVEGRDVLKETFSKVPPNVVELCAVAGTEIDVGSSSMRPDSSFWAVNFRSIITCIVIFVGFARN